MLELFPARPCARPGLSLGRGRDAGWGMIAPAMVLALALWNGRDPILKDRMFGLTNGEGNHGEDVKELWYYQDGTPAAYFTCGCSIATRRPSSLTSG